MDYKAQYADLAATRDKMLVEAEVIFQKMMKLQFLIDHGSQMLAVERTKMETEITK